MFFNSIRRVIDDLLGSLLQPPTEWILRQGWMIRAACLAVVAFGAFAWWQPQTVGDAAERAEFYWRAWTSPAASIPVDSKAAKALSTAVDRLSDSAEADVAGDFDHSHLTAWAASQSVLALAAVGQPLPDSNKFVSFVRETELSGCFCWTERPGEQRADVVSPISGWVASALARQHIALTEPEWDYVLHTQDPSGWWPMFPESGAARYGSSYATAWLLYGLKSQWSAGLVPPSRRAEVQSAIARGSSWLLRSRGEKGRWKSHFNDAPEDISDSVSGFVLVVLHELERPDLADVDRSWLDTLPKSDLEPDSKENHYTELTYDNGTAIDRISQVRLPWILLATAKAYANGSVGERARALKWIERVLKDPKVRNADTGKDSWLRAELLLGLAETKKAIASKPS